MFTPPARASVGLGYVSEDAHSGAPGILVGHTFRIYNDLVRERVRVGGGDGWNMVFVAVDNGYYFVGGFLEGFGHCAAHFENVYTRRSSQCMLLLAQKIWEPTSLRAGRRKRHVQRPLLPAHIFVGFSKKVRLSSPLLEELHD